MDSPIILILDSMKDIDSYRKSGKLSQEECERELTFAALKMIEVARKEPIKEDIIEV